MSATQKLTRAVLTTDVYLVHVEASNPELPTCSDKITL